MKENHPQYHLRATPVPTTQTTGTNYPDFAATAGRLVEGRKVPQWKQAINQMAVAYPDRPLRNVHLAPPHYPHVRLPHTKNLTRSLPRFGCVEVSFQSPIERLCAAPIAPLIYGNVTDQHYQPNGRGNDHNLPSRRATYALRDIGDAIALLGGRVLPP